MATINFKTIKIISRIKRLTIKRFFVYIRRLTKCLFKGISRFIIGIEKLLLLRTIFIPAFRQYPFAHRLLHWFGWVAWFFIATIMMKGDKHTIVSWTMSIIGIIIILFAYRLEFLLEEEQKRLSQKKANETQQKIIKTATGGDGFCFFVPKRFGDLFTLDLIIVQDDNIPIYDVSYEITGLGEVKNGLINDKNIEETFNTIKAAHYITNMQENIGVTTSGIAKTLYFMIPDKLYRFIILIKARNFIFNQVILLGKMEDRAISSFNVLKRRNKSHNPNLPYSNIFQVIIGLDNNIPERLADEHLGRKSKYKYPIIRINDMHWDIPRHMVLPHDTNDSF